MLFDRPLRSDSGQQGGSGSPDVYCYRFTPTDHHQTLRHERPGPSNWILRLDARQQLTDHRRHLNKPGMPSTRGLYNPILHGLHGTSRSGLPSGLTTGHRLDETSRLMGPAARLRGSLYFYPTELAMEHRTQAYNQGHHSTGTLDRCITSSP